MTNAHFVTQAITAGLLPALIWLFFWSKEYSDHPEPKTLFLLCFVAGMMSVFIVLPFEQLVKEKFFDSQGLTVFWAALEELIKYFAAYVVIKNTNYLKRPIDYPIFFITVALGFAALENALFLLGSIKDSALTVSLITGNLRFLGATLLHSVASSIIGVSLGFAFYKTWFQKKIHLYFGLLTAIILHSAFNLFIMKGTGQKFLAVFGGLWFVTIIIIFLFEKLRRINIELPTN